MRLESLLPHFADETAEAFEKFGSQPSQGIKSLSQGMLELEYESVVDPKSLCFSLNAFSSNKGRACWLSFPYS